jgi:hypothetical protein
MDGSRIIFSTFLLLSLDLLSIYLVAINSVRDGVDNWAMSSLLQIPSDLLLV